jgi:hypothetical protein
VPLKSPLLPKRVAITSGCLKPENLQPIGNYTALHHLPSHGVTNAQKHCNCVSRGLRDIDHNIVYPLQMVGVGCSHYQSLVGLQPSYDRTLSQILGPSPTEAVAHRDCEVDCTSLAFSIQ